MAPKFSFIIPTYNEAGYITDCIQSICAQSWPRHDYEVIVVDSLSLDGTARIAQRWADRVISTRREGPGTARNRGARAARGEILIFADADVRFQPDFLIGLDRAFSKRVVVGTIFRLCPYDAKSAPQAMSYGVVNRIAWWMNTFGVSITTGSCFAYRAQAFRDAGCFDEELLTGEDHELVSRISKLGRFLVLNTQVKTSARRITAMGLWAAFRLYVRFLLCYIKGRSLREYWDDGRATAA